VFSRIIIFFLPSRNQTYDFHFFVASHVCIMDAPTKTSSSRIACEQCSKAKTGCDKKEPSCSRCYEKNLDCKFRYARRPPRANLHMRRQMASSRRLSHPPYALPGQPGASSDPGPSASSMYPSDGHFCLPPTGARQLGYQPLNHASYCPPADGLSHQIIECHNVDISAINPHTSFSSYPPMSYESLLAGRFEGSPPANGLLDPATAFNGLGMDQYWSGDGTNTECTDDAGAAQNAHFPDNGLFQDLSLEVQHS
jgi:hypothetical protein